MQQPREFLTQILKPTGQILIDLEGHLKEVISFQVSPLCISASLSSSYSPKGTGQTSTIQTPQPPPPVVQWLLSAQHSQIRKCPNGRSYVLL